MGRMDQMEAAGGLSSRSLSANKSLFNNMIFEGGSELQTLGHTNLTSSIHSDSRSSCDPSSGRSSNFLGMSSMSSNPLSRDNLRKERMEKEVPGGVFVIGGSSSGKEIQEVHFKVYAQDVDRSSAETDSLLLVDETEDTFDEVDIKESPCTTHLRKLGTGLDLPGESRKAYLTAPCDGNPTTMTLHRHQSSGLLELFLDNQHGSMFVLAAKKQRGRYIIFQEKGDKDTSGPNFLGKIITDNRSDYTLHEYDEGKFVQTAGVCFKKRFSATGAPRRLTVVIPELGGPEWAFSMSDSLLGVYRASKGHPEQQAGLRILKNTLPIWDEQAKGYVLDMSPRIRIPSVKNFQMRELMSAEKEPSGEVLLEFGKSSPTEFALECKAPISILQAFTVAVAMVDSSLLVTV